MRARRAKAARLRRYTPRAYACFKLHFRASRLQAMAGESSFALTLARSFALARRVPTTGVVDQGRLYGLLNRPFDFEIELVNVNAVSGANDAD